MTDEQRPEVHKVRVTDKRVVMPDGSEPPAPSPSSDEPEAPVREDPLAAALQLAEERLDQLKRSQADFLNVKQRMVREQTEIVDRASRRIVEKLIPVLDDFERALASAREHSDDAVVKGVELVLSKLNVVLSEEGLERVEAVGAPFDPMEHEAMTSQTGQVSEPTVLEVVQPGYKLKGRTIRPALVRVETPEEGA